MAKYNDFKITPERQEVIDRLEVKTPIIPIPDCEKDLLRAEIDCWFTAGIARSFYLKQKFHRAKQWQKAARNAHERCRRIREEYDISKGIAI